MSVEHSAATSVATEESEERYEPDHDDESEDDRMEGSGNTPFKMHVKRNLVCSIQTMRRNQEDID